MKRILLVLLVILYSISLNAQFVLTNNGLYDSNNKDYYVVNHEGHNKQKLFGEYLVAISKSCISPKDVISKVDGEQISLNILIKNGVLRNSMHKFDLNATIIFEFKDNKVKISPIINSITNILEDGTLQTMYIQKKVFALDKTQFSIFNGDGELKNEKAKYTLENTINNIIKSIISNVNNSKNNDW
jgi:hypothetical protein